MITQDSIIKALSDLAILEQIDSRSLRDTLELYPYCEPIWRLYLKKLSLDNDIRFEQALQNASIYISNRKWLHNYLFKEPTVQESFIDLQSSPIAGDYLGSNRTPEQRASLQELAAKLKAARLQKKAERLEQEIVQAVETTEIITVEIPDATKENLKIMLQNKKYLQALQILEALYLKYPEESVYFAVQIKFVKTIIENNKNN